MPEQLKLELSLQRQPAIGLHADDVVGVRLLLQRATADTYSMKGQLPGELLFVGAGWMDTAATDGAVELGHEAVLAMMLRSYGAGDVIRRFRRGEIIVEGRRFVALVELTVGASDRNILGAALPDSRPSNAASRQPPPAPRSEARREPGFEASNPLAPHRWWRALRRVGTGAASVGVFHGEWEEREGDTLDTLEEELHEWIDASKVEVTHMHRELQPQPPADDLRMAIAEVTGTLPDHPCEVAQALAGLLDAELLRPGPKCLLIFAFRGTTLERWEVRGTLGAPVEDLVRAIAAQGPVEAMAMVHPAVIDMSDGVRRRCFVTTVERNGRLGQRMLPLEFEGKVARALEPKFRDGGELAPGTGWIGVAPKVIVDLTAVGPVEFAEAELPEA